MDLIWNDTDTVIRREIRALRVIMAENRHASARTDRHTPAHTGRMNGLQRSSTLKLATWNCGGLSFTQRELCAELGYDVLGLTETHAKGSLPHRKHCLTGDAAPTGDPYSGVTMLLSDRVADSVMYNGCLGSRIVYARIRASPCNLFVVCVYVPHAGRQNPSSTDTLGDLEALLTSVPMHDCTIVLGDFNAKLARSTGRQTGRWCIHNRANQAGEMLGSLMERRRLCAVSTLHQPRHSTTNATYLSKDQRYGPSQIDYVLASCRWATSAHKSRVKWCVSCRRWGRHYDHGLVTCDWHCRITSRAQRERYVDYSTLARDEELQERFNAAVVSQLEDSPCDLDNASASLTRLTKCVTDAARKTLPLKRSQPLRKRHVSERTEQLYDDRRRNYARQSDDERREATRAITVSSREDYREYVNGVLDDIEGAESVGNMRKVTKLTRTLANKNRFSNINPSKGADGKKIVSTTHLLGEWKTFLGSKFKRPASDENRNIESTAAQEDSLSENELTDCLLALHSGKATGWDNIPIEAYRGSSGARSELFRICRLMWTTEQVPADLVSTFVMIHKKGQRDDFNNYRAICLLCHAYKLLSAVVARRLMEVLDGHLPDTQAGFRPARGCRYNVCALRWFIDMVLCEGRQAVITFIDYTAAFDTESQLFLDSALADAGISVKVRRIIQAIFAAATGVVRIRQPSGENVLSEPFNIERGVIIYRVIYSPLCASSQASIRSSGCTTFPTLGWWSVRQRAWFSWASLSTRMTPLLWTRTLR